MIDKQYYYDGKKNLRSTKTKVEIPKNYFKEMDKIKNDIVYFAEKYFYIIDTDKGKSLIKLHEFQKTMLRLLVENQYCIFNCSRQIGKTTVVKIYIVWYLLTNVDKHVGIASYIEKSSIKILSEIKFAYIELPLWMQFSVLEWNVKSIVLANGCIVLTSATTGNTFRGESINFLYVDETAIIPNNLWQEFEDSVLPTISSSKTSRIAYTSTPKGFNHFYQISQDAINKVSDFNYFEAWWSDVPGRDENWKRKTMNAISGFNKSKLFAQNYECAFKSEDSTFLTSDDLKSIVKIKPINNDESFRIYKEFNPDHKYVMGVDTASGKEGDMSAIVVLDITAYPFEVVSTFIQNDITTLEFAMKVKIISLKYNAIAVIENNTYGLSVIEYLQQELDFYDIARKNKQWGIYTTKQVKLTIVETIKNLIEMKQLIVNDMDLYMQLTKFVKKSNGTYSAMKNYNDDLVMALGMAVYIIYMNEYDGENFLEIMVDEKKKTDESYNLIISDIDNTMSYSGFNNDNMRNYNEFQNQDEDWMNKFLKQQDITQIKPKDKTKNKTESPSNDESWMDRFFKEGNL